MTRGSYSQFCPVAMAAETLCTRWTMLLLRELTAGSTRFNDIRRGVPRMSPTLLSQRLKELESAGILVKRKVPGERGVWEYVLTQAGEDLRPVVEAFGIWGQKWVESRPSLDNLDPSLLMWDMRRCLDPTPLPNDRTTIQFRFPELSSARRNWWLVVEPDGDVDLCSVDPGFDIDLYVTTDLKTLTAIWMGLQTVASSRDRIELSGAADIASSMQSWLGLSPFAPVRKLVR